MIGNWLAYQTLTSIRLTTTRTRVLYVICVPNIQHIVNMNAFLLNKYEKYYPSLWLHFALTTQTLFFHWGNILPYWSSIWGLCVPWVYEGFGTRNVHCCSNKRNKMYLFITTINTAVKWTIKINDMKISVTNVSAVIEK